MPYLDQEGKVVYMSRDGKDAKVFPALEWLAAKQQEIRVMEEEL